MKKVILSTLAVILFTECTTNNTVGANGVTYDNALDYNDYIINRQNDIMKDITAYSQAAEISIDEADKGLDKMITDASIKLKDIEGMPAFNGDSVLRNAAIALFSLYKTDFGNEFRSMHQLKRKVEEGTATDEDHQKLGKFSDNISAKEDPLDEKFKEAQTKFAKDNNITLIENNVQK